MRGEGGSGGGEGGRGHVDGRLSVKEVCCGESMTVSGVSEGLVSLTSLQIYQFVAEKLTNWGMHSRLCALLVLFNIFH